MPNVKARIAIYLLLVTSLGLTALTAAQAKIISAQRIVIRELFQDVTAGCR